MAIADMGVGSATSAANRSSPSLPGVVVAGSAPTGRAAFLGPARRVRVGTVKIGYRQFGHGPALLVVTGYAAPMSLWGTQLPKLLSEHFRVTMFDNRGTGYSTDDLRQRETVPLLANDAAALAGVLHLRRPTVVGWSMGGQIALRKEVVRL